MEVLRHIHQFESTFYKCLKYSRVTNRCYVKYTLFLIIFKTIIRVNDILILQDLIIPHVGILQALFTHFLWVDFMQFIVEEGAPESSYSISSFWQDISINQSKFQRQS